MAASAVSHPAFSAPQLVLSLRLVEYCPHGRSGAIDVYALDPSPGGYGPSMSSLDPDLKPYDTGLGVVTTWNGTGGCGGAFQAGGQQVGWLLGPVTDRLKFQSLAPYAASLYGVVTGIYGDIGYAVDDNCDGSSYSEKWSYWQIFLRSNPDYIQGQGYYVADGRYVTERYQAGNWYSIYSDKPLNP